MWDVKSAADEATGQAEPVQNFQRCRAFLAIFSRQPPMVAPVAGVSVRKHFARHQVGEGALLVDVDLLVVPRQVAHMFVETIAFEVAVLT